jgi:fructoselysine 6-phosphate deglycase
VGEDLRKYFAYLIVNGLLRQYADWLAEHRGHPLSVRRYMWKMEY